MTPAELRIQLRAALSLCRQYRKDSQEHLKACYDDVMNEPQADWPWYIRYFSDQAQQHRGSLRNSEQPPESAESSAPVDVNSRLSTDIQIAKDAARQGDISDGSL